MGCGAGTRGAAPMSPFGTAVRGDDPGSDAASGSSDSALLLTSLLAILFLLCHSAA